MKTRWMTLALVAGLLLTGNSLFAESRFSFGIGIGTPGYYYAPPPPVVYRPPYPGPGYYWVDGYYDPYNAWIPGYWAPLAYRYGYAAPRYYSAPRFYGGYYRGGWGNGYRDHHEFRGRDWGRGHRH